MRRIRIAAISVCLAGLIGFTFSPCFAAQSTATTYQINPAHTGQTTFAKPLTAPLKLAWKINPGGDDGTVSYPLIANGIVYVTIENVSTGNSTLMALSLKNGATIWTKSISASYGLSLVAYDNGRVFDVSFNGLVQAYSAEFGTLLWSQNVSNRNTNQFGYPPIAADGMVYVGGDAEGGTVFALDEVTGNVAWNATLDNGVGTPAYGGGGLYIDTSCNYSKYNAATGKLDWFKLTGCFGGGNYTPVYYQQHVFDINDVSAGGPIELSATNGKFIRAFNALYPPAIWPAVRGATLLIAPSDNSLNLDAYNESSGSSAWSFAGDSQFETPALVVGNIVVAGSHNGTLYLLNAETGAQLWSTSVGAQIGAPGTTDGQFQAMGAAEQTLLVPAGPNLSAYVSAKK